MELSEREYFALVGMRPGMYVTQPSFLTLTAFLMGYDQCTFRHGMPGLDGWREWLIAREGGEKSNQAWWALVLEIAFPKGSANPAELASDEDVHATKVLFELLDEFLARDS